MDKEKLVSIYMGLMEIEKTGNKTTTDMIAQQTGFDKQTTEIALDELEHMGLIEEEDEWIPLIFRREDN